MTQKFVKTSDPAVAEELRKNGFTEMGKSGSMFNFLNNGRMSFSEDIKKKVAFTNMLAI